MNLKVQSLERRINQSQAGLINQLLLYSKQLIIYLTFIQHPHVREELYS